MQNSHRLSAVVPQGATVGACLPESSVQRQPRVLAPVGDEHHEIVPQRYEHESPRDVIEDQAMDGTIGDSFGLSAMLSDILGEHAVQGDVQEAEQTRAGMYNNGVLAEIGDMQNEENTIFEHFVNEQSEVSCLTRELDRVRQSLSNDEDQIRSDRTLTMEKE